MSSALCPVNQIPCTHRPCGYVPRMPLPADYHMHPPLCRHAKGLPVEYATQAVKCGVPEIGFSDHSPVEKDDQDDWRMLAGELDDYVVMVAEAQQEFPVLHIKLGLEVDFIPGHERWAQTLAD